MATLKKVSISRNWGVRPNDNGIYLGNNWMVEKGQPYDLVQFSINEINGYYWEEALCVPIGITEEDAKQLCEEAVSYITDKAIKDYKWFLDMGNKYGWD